VSLRPLACWDCGCESCRGHGCLSVVSVVCCQVEVSVMSWSLVQTSPTKCGVSKLVCSWSFNDEEALALWGCCTMVTYKWHIQLSKWYCNVVFCIVTIHSMVDYCQHLKKTNWLGLVDTVEVNGSIIFLYDIFN